MTKAKEMPNPERAIDAMIAAVRQEIEDWDKAEKAASWGALRGENYAQRASLRAALRVLEAAKAWETTWLAEPDYWQEEALALYRSVRGEPG